jgi:hypothetical protein
MEPTAQDEKPQETPSSEAPRAGKVKRCWGWVIHHKKFTIPGAIVVVMAILAVIPATRFAIAGTFLQQDFNVRILDQETNKPVSSAEVTLAGKQALTDGQGRATVKVRVGSGQLSVAKKYYKDANADVTVPILRQKQAVEIELEATGRQIPLTVVNKISKKAVAGIAITAGDAKAKTDKSGKATLVVSADKQSVEVSFGGEGYNTHTQTIQVQAQTAATEVAVTPAGKLYFLSNQTGKLDVVKTNLDGTDRQVVLPGTGKEDKNSTIVLASRDWKYLALLSRRDGGDHAKLFLIDTATDQVTTMDEGKAEFSIYGWADHRFVYKVARAELQVWQPNKYALKSYDAPARKITTLDQTQAEGSQQGYAAQELGTVYLVNDQVLYHMAWGGWTAHIQTKTNVIRSVQANGQGKKDYKTFEQTRYGGLVSNPYAFNEIYYQTWDNQTNKYAYFEFEDGKVEPVTLDESAFWQSYPTYFISPSAQHTFWSDIRDGKQALFISDKNGKNEKQIASLVDFATYGWFTDEYVLVSKKGSELYIMPAAGLADGEQPQKIVDYYRPSYIIRGYGGGY